MTAPTLAEKARAVAEALCPGFSGPLWEFDHIGAETESISDCYTLAPLDGNFMLAVIQGMEKRWLFLEVTEDAKEIVFRHHKCSIQMDGSHIRGRYSRHHHRDSLVEAVISAAYDALQEWG